jgi:hypothetical protein
VDAKRFSMQRCRSASAICSPKAAIKNHCGNETVDGNRLSYFREHAPAVIQKQYDDLRIRMDEIEQLLKSK